MKKTSAVIVLTLEGCDDRRSALLSSLQEQDISYELFYGVDGRKGLSASYEMMVDRMQAERAMQRPVTNGELACALSHRAIYQHILERNLDAALVLEDDALIQSRLGEFLRSGGMYIKPMILLDYSRVSVSRFSGENYADFGKLWRIVANPVFATGYIVSAQAARYLMKVTTPIRSVADWPGDLYYAEAYVLSPRLVDHLPVGNELSHLAPDREPNIPRTRKKSRSRYLTSTYWRAYLRRRMAMRIAP